MTRNLVLLTLCAALAPAQSLTQNERNRAMSELHASRKMLIDATSGLGEKQLAFKPAPEKWSIAEIVEHLAITENFLFGFYQQVAKSTADPNAKASSTDEDLLKNLRNRQQKFQAPDPATPKKTFPSTAEALKAYDERRDRTIVYVETTQDQDLRHKIVPNFGMDGYQMFLMLAAHTARHVDQIAEVKAAAGYPAK